MALTDLMRYKYAATCHRRVAHAAPLVGAVVRRSTHPPTQYRFHDLELQPNYRHLVCRHSFGSTSADSIDALGGDDLVTNGGSESDIVALGTGNDSVNFSADADGVEVYGQGGNDSLGFTASLNTSTVSGGSANDTLWISKGSAYKAYGDLGNDTITINADFLGASVFGGNESDAPLAMVPTAFPFQDRHLLPSLPVTAVMTPSTSVAASRADPAFLVVKAAIQSMRTPHFLVLT